MSILLNELSSYIDSVLDDLTHQIEQSDYNGKLSQLEPVFQVLEYIPERFHHVLFDLRDLSHDLSNGGIALALRLMAHEHVSFDETLYLQIQPTTTSEMILAISALYHRAIPVENMLYVLDNNDTDYYCDYLRVMHLSNIDNTTVVEAVNRLNNSIYDNMDNFDQLARAFLAIFTYHNRVDIMDLSHLDGIMNYMIENYTIQYAGIFLACLMIYADSQSIEYEIDRY